jgi:hypothetical protein
MKVTNWCRNLRVTLLAAGITLPGLVQAQVIALGDPSFEDYVVPAAVGYAYAAPPYGTYRPTSAWVDDLDSPTFYTQDDNDSNWLYDANYAETGSGARKRAAPRTGNQAMHGLLNYNAQEAAAVFEANKSYTFSVWSQGDDDATSTTSRVFLYIFDGAVPFSEADSLTFQRYGVDTGDFLNRATGMTQAQSKANWTKIDLVHHVREGASEIGHPVGVGFWVADDGAVDDATLRADPIENFLLYLEVNTSNGQVAIKNETGQTVHIDYYEILSDDGLGNSLDEAGWNSFQDPSGNPAGFPSGDGSGNGWEEAGGSDEGVLSESYLLGSSGVADGASISLGAAFRTGFPQDLKFSYGALLGEAAALDGDFNGDNRVDAADYPVWKATIGTQAAYDMWRANFGAVGGPSGPSTLIEGFVRYVTSGGGAAAAPEASTLLMVGIGLSTLAAGCRRRTEKH